MSEDAATALSTGKAVATKRARREGQVAALQAALAPRKGQASSEFQTAKEKGKVMGNVIWNGKDNLEGAHILPDKYAGEYRAYIKE